MKLVTKARARVPSITKNSSKRGIGTRNDGQPPNNSGVQPLEITKQLRKISQTPTSNPSLKSAPVNSEQVHGGTWDDVVNEIEQNSRDEETRKKVYEMLKQMKAAKDPFHPEHQTQLKALEKEEDKTP